jgi:hypothetical protein
VEKVNSDLVVRDADGKALYGPLRGGERNAAQRVFEGAQAFVQEQRKVQEQGATIARLEKQIDALAAGLQKVSAQLAAATPSGGGLELSKPAPQVVVNP